MVDRSERIAVGASYRVDVRRGFRIWRVWRLCGYFGGGFVEDVGMEVQRNHYRTKGHHYRRSFASTMAAAAEWGSCAGFGVDVSGVSRGKGARADRREVLERKNACRRVFSCRRRSGSGTGAVWWGKIVVPASNSRIKRENIISTIRENERDRIRRSRVVSPILAHLMVTGTTTPERRSHQRPNAVKGMMKRHERRRKEEGGEGEERE